MILPPGVSESDFTAAISQFQQAVGADWVFTSDADLELYRDAYSPFWDEDTELRASAAVAPDRVEQVQEVVRTANRYRIPVYPISTGRNLAYGGAAPTLTGSVVIDLKRMNRVLAVSERNAYALVEPGVSYFELYRHIQERGLKVWVDVPTPGWGSVVGNALDHGAGFTRMSDHFGACCGMEVVLPDGELLRTGMGAMPNAETWQQFKYGIGPYVDGLFSQSNYGVVTKMGFWLMPEPDKVRSLRVLAPRHDDAIPLVDTLSNLIYQGVIDSHVQLASPVLSGPRNAEFDALRARPGGGSAADWDRYARERGQNFWNLRVTFYGPEPVVDARWEHTAARFSAIPGIAIEEGLTHRFPMSAEQREVTPEKTLLGIPSLDTFMGRTPANPQAADGHMDFSVIVPMTGEGVLSALKVLGRAFAEQGIGSLGTIQSFHPRTFLLINSLPTMRNDREANRRMRAAYREYVQLAADQGWGQYRAHAGFMDVAMATYSLNDNVLTRFHHQLKEGIDPNGIMSPGRYGIWPARLRGPV
jgi:(+)-pinoresinol hydroxylase